MHTTVTGAGGFLGRRLVQRLCRDKTITRIVAADLMLSDPPADPRIAAIEGDVSDPAIISQLVSQETRAVFHLAAVVSVGCEEDFDLGMRINHDATRALLDACRRNATCPQFLFASSAAVFGGDLPPTVTDDTALTPQTSYGTQKAIAELLINDYSRRGFIDGRALRLPTIVVRPGAPNKAASTFASTIIRDPLLGRDAVCPVSADTNMCLLSPGKVIESFIHAQSIPAKRWGFSRAVQLPGLELTVAQMLSALEEVAGPAVAARVRFELDPRVERIVHGWPTSFRTDKAARLGFAADGSMQEIIRAFIADERGISH